MSGCRPTVVTPTPPTAETSTDDEPALVPAMVPALVPALVPSVAVAYSGGRDSTALLHATVVEAQALGLRVIALHVHHGLSSHADDWAAHCEAQCRRWRRRGRAVDFVADRLTTRPAAGESVEAWARDARYAALRALASAHGASVVLLGHHRRDQAETFLLQALRGAGTAGLSSMPTHAARDGILWVRPWLHRSRSEVDAYVRRHRLAHIDDDSNCDARFARNRLRLDIWPTFVTAFPDAEAALARAAGWAQDADAALRELAEIDLSASGAESTRLPLQPWFALSPPRRSNALRAWLMRATGQSPTAPLTLRLLDELLRLGTGRWPVDGGELRLYRGVLRFHFIRGEEKSSGLPKEMSLGIRATGVCAVPGWGGRLHVREVREGGVPLTRLANLALRVRGGGERFQSHPDRPPRSLKKQFQGAAIAAWDRHGPLLYSDGQLVYVPGLGLDARVIGLPGAGLVTLRWEPPAAAEEDVSRG